MRVDETIANIIRYDREVGVGVRLPMVVHSIAKGVAVAYRQIEHNLPAPVSLAQEGRGQLVPVVKGANHVNVVGPYPRWQFEQDTDM